MEQDREWVKATEDDEGDADDSDAADREVSGHAVASATANGKRKAADFTAPDAQRLVIRLLMNHTAKEATVLREFPSAKRPKQTCE